MLKAPATLLVFLATLTLAGFSVAGDGEACLECHEPQEDWVGMSVEEMLAAAKDPGNKRHKDTMQLGDEQLLAIIAELTATKLPAGDVQ